MNAELKLKTELEALAELSPGTATMEPDGFVIIHLESDDLVIKLESDHCAVAMGSIQGLDVLSENLNIEEDDILSYSGVSIPEDVYAVLETFFGQIEEL